ncbi:MAG TPA: helix-turn-helix transcriptional regulator [Gemmataceae bacterium]|nr:helix-turn-helix transcriptional regulator [Gemmataceae bacterium]
MTDGPTQPGTTDLAAKIARLVEERGWNQSDFARIAGLNLQTIRQILVPSGDRRLRNATIAACARALGLTVSELRTLPLERLLGRMHNPRPADGDGGPGRKRLYEEATQPELLDWLERNEDRAKLLTGDEIDELLSLQGTGGPLTSFGVEHFVQMIERKRGLLDKVQAIAGTEYLDFLEQFVDLLYEKVQPYANRR